MLIAGEAARFVRFRQIDEATKTKSVASVDDLDEISSVRKSSSSGGGGGDDSSLAGSVSTSLTKREEAQLIEKGGLDIMYALAAVQLRFGGHDPGLLASCDNVLAALEETGN